ncbi:MAG: hypothetical protein ACK55I_36660, partial [bacterium]
LLLCDFHLRLPACQLPAGCWLRPHVAVRTVRRAVDPHPVNRLPPLCLFSCLRAALTLLTYVQRLRVSPVATSCVYSVTVFRCTGTSRGGTAAGSYAS